MADRVSLGVKFYGVFVRLCVAAPSLFFFRYATHPVVFLSLITPLMPRVGLTRISFEFWTLLIYWVSSQLWFYSGKLRLNSRPSDAFLNQIATLLKRPMRCKFCNFGPVDFSGCSNLHLHWNSCPGCTIDLFHIRQWERWDYKTSCTTLPPLIHKQLVVHSFASTISVLAAYFITRYCTVHDDLERGSFADREWFMIRLLSDALLSMLHGFLCHMLLLPVDSGDFQQEIDAPQRAAPQPAAPSLQTRSVAHVRRALLQQALPQLPRYCVICHDPISKSRWKRRKIAHLTCGHFFHSTCLRLQMQVENGPCYRKCAICKTPFSEELVAEVLG